MYVILSLQESDEPSDKETKEKSPSDSSSDDYNKDVVSCPISRQNKDCMAISIYIYMHS